MSLKRSFLHPATAVFRAIVTEHGVPPRLINHAAICATAALLLLSSAADAKLWRNTDGSKSFQGDMLGLSDEKVKIRMLNDSIIDLPLSRLHPDDRKWAIDNAKDMAQAAAEARERSLFANLNFGDEKETVLRKLKESPLISADFDERLIGRSGLNGLFKTKAKIGPYHCDLYFNWSPANRLTELTLRSQTAPESDYEENLTACWEQMIHLLSEKFGKPGKSAKRPDFAKIEDGYSLNTHVWNLKSGGSALVGFGRQDDAYMVTARFSNARVKLGQ